MRKIKLSISLLTLLTFFLHSCSDINKSSTFHKKDLIDYFETDDLNIENKTSNKVEIIIKNSSLVKRERKKKGTRWTNTEAFSSIGALILSDQIKTSDIDSITVSIENGTKLETYEYRLRDLKYIRKYVNVCINFSKFIENKDFLNAKQLLSRKILDNTDSSKLNNFLTNVISQNAAIKSELIAFKIQDNIVGLYINLYYDNKEAQTYIFSFLLGDDGKIAGIRTPEID